MSRFRVWPVFLLMVAALGVSAMGRTSQPERAGAQPKASRPALAFLIWYDSFGTKPGGLIAAGWDDGLVVFALDPDRAGENLHVGRVQPADLARALDELHGTGFFEKQKERGLVPDNSYTTMSAMRSGMSAVHRWNEALSVPWGAHTGADDQFRRFARMWAVSRTALAFACPQDHAPLSTDAEAERRSRAVKNGNEWIR